MLHNFEAVNFQAPLHLDIEITHKCTLNCKYCFNQSSSLEYAEISLEIFNEIVEEAKKMSIFEICISGGEPFIHKDIMKMISKIKNLGLGISIVTNATLITKKKANQLSALDVISNMQVSFDGHNKEIHEKTRRDFDKSLKGFLNLCEQVQDRHRAPSVGIVISKYNYMQIPNIVNFFKNYTNRFNLMAVQKCNELELSTNQKREFETKYLPITKDIFQQEKLRGRIIEDNDTSGFEMSRTHIDCLAGIIFLVISPELDIYPCDIVRKSLGKWEHQGSLKKAYENAKVCWSNLNCSWCQN